MRPPETLNLLRRVVWKHIELVNRVIRVCAVSVFVVFVAVLLIPIFLHVLFVLLFSTGQCKSTLSGPRK